MEHHETAYLRVHEVAKLIGVGVSTVWAMANDGRLPRPFRLGRKITVWGRDEIQVHIRSLDADTPPAPAKRKSTNCHMHPNVVEGQRRFWNEVRAGIRRHPRETEEAFLERRAQIEARRAA